MIERALAEYVVNTLWQLPVLAGGAWLFIRTVRPGPRMQHGIWLAVLALAVLLPGRGLRKAAVAPATTIVTQERMPSGEGAVPFFARTRDLTLNPTVSRWLVRLYLATVMLALLRVARAWHAAHQLVARSREIHRHRVELAGLSRRFAVKAPQLRESEEVSSPMVVGVRTSILLLPEGFAQFAEEQVRAAFCHELAHIQRQDYLMNLVCQVAALPLAWHPVVHEVQQQIRMTREIVCDAMAAQEMESHLGYAKCLLALANSMLGREIPGQAEFLGLFSKNTLEARVMRLMDKTTMSMRARVTRAATGAVVMIATGSLAALLHVTPTLAEQSNSSANDLPKAAIASAAEQTQPAPAPKPEPARHTARSKKAEQRIKVREILDDPEFTTRMEDAERQMAKANAILDNPEFKQRMQEAQRQMAAARVILDDPEFRKKMGAAQRQMAKAAEVFNSTEFKEEMERMKREIEEDTAPTN